MKASILNEGVRIREVGSFFAGGKIVTLADQPRQHVQVARNAPERVVNLNGDYVTGQCYVQYVQQMRPMFNAPLMFWHGGAMTGAAWETTPDGRSGWQTFFMLHGFDTFVCDAMERGRAGWSPHPQIYQSAPIYRTLNEAWSMFRLGDAEGYATDKAARKPFAGSLFPHACFDQFAAQFVPRWTDHSDASLAAYYKALQRVGPVWLIAHSQGGNLALEAAASHPEYFRGVVIIEAASAPDQIGDAHKVPHLFVWGDNIKQSSTWQAYREKADVYADKLRQSGGIVQVLDLPAMGTTGNSHVPMMDKNSDDVAAMVLRWIIDSHTAEEIEYSTGQAAPSTQ